MSKAKILLICLVWLGILGIGAISYKLIVVPSKDRAKAKEDSDKKSQVLIKTGTDSRYDCQINFAVDSFSGYATLRSNEFAEELAWRRIKLNLVDDGADYLARLKSIKSGDIQMGAFTVDALIKTSAELGELPATIVAIVDETRGADAIVSYKDAIPNIDSLNREDVKFILTPNSPSETLARVVMAHFNLNRLSAKPFIETKDAEEVYKAYRAAKPDEKKAFVVWEPYVSKILENPNLHVLVDSSRFKGYIVDVIVVNRNFLYANRDVVAKVVESYFKANYHNKDKMFDLIMKDAQQLGTPVTSKQAEALVNGIWWKNTLENYVQFGVDKGNLQHIEDIIGNITKILVRSKAIGSDPTNGKPNLLYYPEILSGLKNSQFHPGVEKIREDTVKLPVLTDNQWNNLEPVGTLHIPPLVFARGTSILLDQSKTLLDELVTTLETCPQYYLIIRGNASKVGDADANKVLAEARATAAKNYLIEKGVNTNRMRTVAEVSGKTDVEFVLGQLPY